jgi:endonuclease/exonuclease/phosphatase (EEP) superfamily protein YafD
VAAAAVGCAVLAYAAPWVWPAEILASFRPVLALGAAVGAVAALGLRKPVAAVVLALAAVVAFVPVLPLFRGQAAPPAPGVAPLTIAHQNAQGGFGEPWDFLAYLATDAPDILVVLEPTPYWGPILAEGAPAAGYQLVVPDAPPSEERVMVLSRVPLTDVQVHPADDLPPASVEMTAQIGGQDVHLLAIHTQSPLTPNRWALRNSQLDAATRWAQETDGPAAVFGDFNVTPWSPEFTRMLDQMDMVSSSDGHGIQLSWYFHGRQPGLALPIDHLLHTDDLTTTSRRVDDSLGSEHGVLVVSLAPAADGG